MKRPPSPPPINGDPRKRHFSSDSQLDEYLSKKNRSSRPSSWVVTKSASPAAKPVSEEELKKQQEFQLKTNALRERLKVKKVAPKQVIPLNYLNKQVNPLTSNKPVNPLTSNKLVNPTTSNKPVNPDPKPIVRVPSPPLPPRIPRGPETKVKEAEKVTNKIDAATALKTLPKVPATSSTKSTSAPLETVSTPSTSQTLVTVPPSASTAAQTLAAPPQSLAKVSIKKTTPSKEPTSPEASKTDETRPETMETPVLTNASPNSLKKVENPQKPNIKSDKRSSEITQEKTGPGIVKTNENNNTVVLSQPLDEPVAKDQNLCYTDPLTSESNAKKPEESKLENTKSSETESMSKQKSNQTAKKIDPQSPNSSTEPNSSTVEVTKTAELSKLQTLPLTNSKTEEPNLTADKGQMKKAPGKLSVFRKLATVTKKSFGEFQLNVKRKTDGKIAEQKTGVASKSDVPEPKPDPVCKEISPPKTTQPDSVSKTSADLLSLSKESALSKTVASSNLIVGVDSEEIAKSNLVTRSNTSFVTDEFADENTSISDTLASSSAPNEVTLPAMTTPRPESSKRPRSPSPTGTLTKTGELKMLTKKIKADSKATENCPAVSVTNEKKLDNQKEKTDKTQMSDNNSKENQDFIETDKKAEADMSRNEKSDKVSNKVSGKCDDTSAVMEVEERRGQSLQETLKSLTKDTEMEEVTDSTKMSIATRSVVHLVRSVPELDSEVKPESPSQGSSLIQTLQELQDWEERLDVICSSGKEEIYKVETQVIPSSLTAVNENCRDEVKKVVTGLTSKVDQLVAALQPVEQPETAAAKSDTPKPDADKPVFAQLEATAAKSDSLSQDDEANSRQAVRELVSDMTSQVEKNVPTHASCESKVNKINYVSQSQAPNIASQKELLDSNSQTTELATANQNDQCQSNREPLEVAESRQVPSSSIQPLANSLVENQVQIRKVIESAPASEELDERPSNDSLTAQGPTSLELAIKPSEIANENLKTPNSAMSQQSLDISEQTAFDQVHHDCVLDILNPSCLVVMGWL